MSTTEKAAAKGYLAACQERSPAENPYWQEKRKEAWERGFQRKNRGAECGAA